jgi:hypothetical protein
MRCPAWTLRKLAGFAVLLVAAIAATINYLHVHHLAVTLGQPKLAGWLMPLSVDGLDGNKKSLGTTGANRRHVSGRLDNCARPVAN